MKQFLDLMDGFYADVLFVLLNGAIVVVYLLPIVLTCSALYAGYRYLKDNVF